MPPSKTLLLIFVHGFKGNDDTFLDFPFYLRDLLAPTLPLTTTIKPIVYPQYETSGDLNVCVQSFKNWLLPFLLEEDYQSSHSYGSPPPITAAVLIGHSMGGLLLAETILSLPPRAQSRVLGLLAFDTPFLGLEPKMVSTATGKKIDEFKKVYSAVSSLRSFAGGGAGTSTSTAVSSTQNTSATAASSGPSWMRWAAGAGGLAAVAATAAVAYSHREDVASSVSWVDSHLRFVGILFQPEHLTARLSRILVVKPQFANMYTVVREGGTFCKLPIGGGAGWIPARNEKAEDEIQAHMGMFAGATNPGYWEMAGRAREVVRGWVGEWAFEDVWGEDGEPEPSWAGEKATGAREEKEPSPRPMDGNWEREEGWKAPPQERFAGATFNEGWGEEGNRERPAVQQRVQPAQDTPKATEPKRPADLIDLSENPWA